MLVSWLASRPKLCAAARLVRDEWTCLFAATEACLCHSCLSYLLLLTAHAVIDRHHRPHGARQWREKDASSLLRKNGG